MNMQQTELNVLKRSGNYEVVSFDKILNRIKQLGEIKPKLHHVNYTQLTMKVIDQLYDGIKTKEIDELSAQQCASQITEHLDYGTLASRIMISNHHKNTPGNFIDVTQRLFMFKDVHGIQCPIVNETYYSNVMDNSGALIDMIDYTRDYEIDYFGFKTLERAYLMKVDGVIIERPQDMWLRVAIAIHGSNIELVRKTYNLMSNKYFTHATPTLFNAGTPRQQMSSCYLLAMENDSIKGIYNTLSDCAMISKWAGGIGLHIHNIRATGSHIRGTNGTSNGIVPMLRVFNNTARYVDQCVTPETIIYTEKGPMEIGNVIEKETKVYNTNGTLEEIANILEHPYDGEMYAITTKHSIEPLNITGEHPVFGIQNQKEGTNYNVIKNSLDKNLITMDWIDAKDLTEDSLIGYKIPTYENDVSYISEDDCYFYGLMLGNGHMESNKTYEDITLDSVNKQKQIEFVEKYLDNKYIRFTKTEQENKLVTRIRWTKSNESVIKHSHAYNSNKEKRIHHKWLNLPLNKAQFIVKGLIDTDGTEHKELAFDNTSKELMNGLRFLLLRMGVLTSGYVRDIDGETHETNKKISYCLRIPKTPEICNICNIENDNECNNFFKYNDYLFTRIASINKTTYSGTLYDLQMSEYHNYMLDNGIVHNGGGRRNGSFAMYLEPWHADIENFMQMRKNHGDEEMKARDLFYALWIPDLFMKRVKEDGIWTLMCPDKCPGLSDVYGDEFEELYTRYEEENKGNKTMKARDLWFQMLDSQIETGTPYMLYKDAANKKSNQKNLGTIKSSNLCTEIIEYSDDRQTAVCNLASIGLSKFVEPSANKLGEVEIYTKDDCNWCLLLKGLLRKNGYSYTEHHVTAETFDAYKETHKHPTVPLLYSDGVKIGGYDDVNTYIHPVFNFEKLHQVTKVVTGNLNKVIDLNFYPTEKTLRSNMYHRPIGIGVQGLADVFAMMNYSFDSFEAQQLNKDIFETIYHAALEQSNEIAKHRQGFMVSLYMSSPENPEYKKVEWEFVRTSTTTIDDHLRNYNYVTDSESLRKTLDYCKPIKREFTHLSKQYLGAYSSFEGSPASKGILQFDMWKVTPSDRYNWDELKESIKQYGLRNSLLVAPMPTASTSQILGNNECFEPFTSNIYVRRTIAGEFVIMNKYLMEEMCAMGLWNIDCKNNIIANNGSIQMLDVPNRLKEKYRTVWELPMKSLIDMAATRGAFICQSQSMNLWMQNPDYNRLTAMHFYSWSKGLKTGLYYLRTMAKASAQQFTIDPSKYNKKQTEEEEECLMCGS